MKQTKNRQDFYVPSIMPNPRKINRYAIQVLLTFIIFVLIVTADPKILK
jgi:hypothetical protein